MKIQKNNLFKSFIDSLNLTILLKFVTFPIGIFVASIIGTEGYGYLGIMTVTAQFVSYGNFGILNGLNRELPIAKGLGSKKAEDDIYNAVFTFLFISSAFTIISIAFIFYISGSLFQISQTSLIILIILISLSSSIEGFLNNSLKGENQLTVWAFFVTMRPLIDSITALVLVIFFGLNGLITSIILSKLLASFILKHSYIGPKLRPVISFKIVEILKTTTFLMIINLIKTYFVKAPIFLTTGILSTKHIGVITFGIANLFVVEKLAGSQIFAINQRNEFAKLVGSKTIKERHVEHYLSGKYFFYNTLSNGFLSGILASIYYFIITVFLGEFNLLLPSIHTVSSFYFLWSIILFLHQLFDVLKYLYTKMFIVLAGATFFSIIIYFKSTNLGIYQILNIYLLSSYVIFVLTFIFFIYIERSKFILISFLKLILITLTFYLSLKISLNYEFAYLIFLSDYYYLYEISKIFLSLMSFALLFITSIFILYHSEFTGLILEISKRIKRK